MSASYLAELQDNNLSDGRVSMCIRHVRTFYRANGVRDIVLDEPLSRRVTFKDRAPTPDELAKLLEIATLREKVIISMLALGAYREATLAELRYRHVREDLEHGSRTIHIHVEPELVKQQHGDVHTFIGHEAVEYLRLYLDRRRQGNPHWRKGAADMHRLPPEELVDSSPLIRDEGSREPRPIGPKQIRKIVHSLYVKAEIVKKLNGRMYDVRTHSLRKFYETQMLARGVQPAVVDYFMLHKKSVYTDIGSLGVGKLQAIYEAADLSIRRETKAGKGDLVRVIKEMIRARGLNPEEILTREAMADGAATLVDGEEQADRHLKILARTLEGILHRNSADQDAA